MAITEPTDGSKPSDNVICPRCGNSLLPLAIFCSSCGKRIKNEEGETRAENDGKNTQEQEVDDTVRLPSLSRAQWKGLQVDRLVKNNEITGQTSKSSSTLQDVEAPTSKELSASSLPVPVIDAKKNGTAPYSQDSEQQIARLTSVVVTAREHIADASASINGSTRKAVAYMEDVKNAVAMKLVSDQTTETLVDPDKSSKITEPRIGTWGWMPALSLICAIGVFLAALADEGGRLDAQLWPQPLFWFGLLVIFLPIAIRLFSSKPVRRERIVLLILLVVALYLVKYLQYPFYFAGYDEFLHWRTAQNIVASGYLFDKNPLLPISSLYPGLEIATSTLSSLTGLSLFASGTILIGIVQLLFVLSLYLFYEHITGSARVAGIATVLYMSNPQFLFFDMDFAYESLALPLAVFVLFVIAYRSYTPAGHRKGLNLAIWLGLAAVVITHHVTSFAFAAFLLLWTAVFLLLWKGASFQRSRIQKNLVVSSPGGVALLALVLCIVWLIYTGNQAFTYLSPHLDDTMHQITQILTNQSAPRKLFQNNTGFGIPLWERVIAYTSVALILLGIPFGLLRIWQRLRTNAIALALAGGALMYPASQALRLTSAGAEAGNRATEFLFVGIAFVLAIGITEFWLSHTPGWRRSAIILGAVGILCFGQLILGSGLPWTLLPGPYLVSADARSIDPEDINAALWANSHLGPGHRTASDRVNTLLMATFGDEQAVTGASANYPVASVFTSRQFGSGVVAILQGDRIQYLVVDRRLSTSLPYVGTYFNLPASGQSYTSPIAPAALAKFDGVQNVSRIFDSGDIIIYDVEAITNGASAASTPILLCTPVPSSAVSPPYPKVATHYTGTIYNTATGTTTNISLTGVQQQQGAICGSFGGMPTNTHFIAIPSNGPFKGTITTAGRIQFILTSGTGQATVSFDGVILPDGSIEGTYCSPEVGTGRCSNYGLWGVSPAQSG